MHKLSRIMIISCCIVFLGILIAGYMIGKYATAFSESAPLENRTCFIIDAGHGGIDGGAVGCTGVLESKINLEIAARLNDLMHLLGYETVMIRTADVSIHTQGETIAAQKASDLKERVRIVNQTENGILLSIHQNYFSDNTQYGAQMFYSKNPESEKLAKKLQSEFQNHLNTPDNRKAKPAPEIYLMKNIQRPGVLIECGFLSNYAENEKLQNEEYQKNLCAVIAVTCCNYCAENSNLIDEISYI